MSPGKDLLNVEARRCAIHVEQNGSGWSNFSDSDSLRLGLSPKRGDFGECLAHIKTTVPLCF